MRRLERTLLVLVCLTQALPGLAAPAPGAAGAEEELLTIERRRSEAIAAHDTAYLEALYADDFRGVTATGLEVDKARLMEVFKLDDPRTRFAIDELRPRVFGDTAVVTGRLTGRTADGELLSQSVYIHVYVKRDGRWQMVAGQGTPARQAAGQQGS